MINQQYPGQLQILHSYDASNLLSIDNINGSYRRHIITMNLQNYSFKI